MHSVMSSYLDQINRDVQGRDQALNLLQPMYKPLLILMVLLFKEFAHKLLQ